jgi:hypothetical protein
MMLSSRRISDTVSREEIGVYRRPHLYERMPLMKLFHQPRCSDFIPFRRIESSDLSEAVEVIRCHAILLESIEKLDD